MREDVQPTDYQAKVTEMVKPEKMKQIKESIAKFGKVSGML